MCQILRRFSLSWMICSLIHNGTPKHLEVFPALRGASTSHSCVLTPSGTWDTALVSLSVWVDGETKLHCNSSPDPSDHGTRPLRHFTEFYDLRHCQAVVGLELPWEEKQPICLEGPFHTFWMVFVYFVFSCQCSEMCCSCVAAAITPYRWRGWFYLHTPWRCQTVSESRWSIYTAHKIAERSTWGDCFPFFRNVWVGLVFLHFFGVY